VTDDNLSPELVGRLRSAIDKYAAERGISCGEALEDYGRLINYVHELFRAHNEDGKPLPLWLAAAVERAQGEAE
jgi:hypothetical protein